MMNTQNNETVDISDLPRPEVQLTGVNGNVFSVISTVERALKRAGWTSDQLSVFRNDAMSGDYNHALQTCMKYADVC